MALQNDLYRFVSAQQTSYRQVLAEIQNGRKVTHWMWFIFPQLQGLGHSATSQYYAIRSLDEARAYLQDPYVPHRNALFSARCCKNISAAEKIAARFECWALGMHNRPPVCLFHKPWGRLETRCLIV